MSEITKEWNNCKQEKIFEIEVWNKKDKAKDYILFDIEIDKKNKQLIATHEALTEDEEKSEYIAKKVIDIEEDQNLDYHLEGLFEECTQAIIDSDFFYLA